MKSSHFRLALIAGAAIAVAGCASTGGRYGDGYRGVSYGYSTPYYGWYDNYYYPGTGYYVYERSGARHRWNDSQRHYWETHRGSGHRRDNWSGYGGRHHDGDNDRDDHRRRRP
jgi:hypothetical protein